MCGNLPNNPIPDPNTHTRTHTHIQARQASKQGGVASGVWVCVCAYRLCG